MQSPIDYGQSPSSVNTSRTESLNGRQRTRRKGQLFCVNILVGSVRVRVVGSRRTVMGWVRLALMALADKEVAA